MRLGIGTYTFMWSIGFPGATPGKPMRAIDLLAEAERLGVRVVQFGPNLPLYDLDTGEREELLAASRARAISLEIGTRGIESPHLERIVAFTGLCGATLLRTVPEIHGRIPSQQELIAALNAVVPLLENARVCLALENSLIPAAELYQALRTIDSPWLGITLDTVNSLAIPEGTEEVSRHLAPWTRCLHVKDFHVRREWHNMGFRVEGMPAGQGQLDIPQLLSSVRRHHAGCNAILELWPPEQFNLQATIELERRWAEESIRYLRTLIKE